MGNQRLRGQLAIAGLTASDLANTIEVDPKTVERWISEGRVPRSRLRSKAAEALAVTEGYLWPSLLDDTRARETSRAEIVTVYPHRGAVPNGVWRRLIEGAEDQVDVLVYAGLFLIDSNPDLPELLVDRAEHGLAARLLFGDPESDVVAWRGREEGIGENLAARIHLSLNYLEPTHGTAGIEIRQHQTVLYNSLYRFDDELLVNTHVMGSPAPKNPVIHVRRLEGGQLFDHYLTSFERVWASATSLPAPIEITQGRATPRVTIPRTPSTPGPEARGERHDLGSRTQNVAIPKATPVAGHGDQSPSSA